MKKHILFAALVSMLFAGYLLAQKATIPLSKRWEKVNKLAEKQLPESALKEVESILAQARKEKNQVQIIKAMVYRMRFILDKNPDKAHALLKDFEALTEKSSNATERALLHSMTAELYLYFYEEDQWTINSRSDLSGLVPENMNEWTKNIFVNKITKHLDGSLENPSILQKTDALKFKELLYRGADSRTMQPTLFDLLGCRKIEILQKTEEISDYENRVENTKADSIGKITIEKRINITYEQLLQFKRETNNTAAYLNLDLERLEYIRSKNESESADSTYLAALQTLEKQYKTTEYVVEILAEKANFYHEKSIGEISDDDQRLGLDKDRNKFNRIAYNICADGIKRFPAYKRIGMLRNIQAEIQKKELGISYKTTAKPNTNLNININSSNIPKVQLTVYRINTTAVEYYKFAKFNNESIKEYPNRTLIETRTVSIKPEENFGSVNTGVNIKTGGYGIYEFCIEEPNNGSHSKRTVGTFTVTDFGFISRSNVPQIQSVYVLDRQSGEPQENVIIQAFKQQWTENGYRIDLIKTVKTNNTGLCEYQYEGNYYQQLLVFMKGSDVYFTASTEPHCRDNYEAIYDEKYVNLFTDRSVYRPGQTVYFKGIAYFSSKDKQQVVDGKGSETLVFNRQQKVLKYISLEVTLLDSKGQKVATKSVTANEFGSFAGQFVLPEGGLNGAFSLITNAGRQNITNVGSQTIWVEEYKRPTFEVQLQKPTDEIQFGDKIQAKGTVKAFAGYNIADATVKYRVVRRTHQWCWWWSEPEHELTTGITKSKADGSFEISFLAEKTKTAKKRLVDNAYSYTIYTDVTDTKGETQQGEQTVSVGDKSLFILTEIPANVNKNKFSGFEISTETLNGEKVNSVVKYTVSRLAEVDKYAENLDENTNFNIIEEALSGSFETKDKRLNVNLAAFQSGRYKLLLTTTDAHGKEVKTEKIFVLFANTDKRPPVKSYVWLQTPKTSCAVNEIANIQFGTSTLNTPVLYELMQGNTVLEKRWIRFSDEIKTFEIPFEERYGAGVTAMFTFLKDEQVFTKTVLITRKVETKKLTPTLSVFRNKLQPGEKAEWTVNIPESAKDKKPAELLVAMYDASLDAIRPHRWDFYPAYRPWLAIAPVWNFQPVEVGSNNVFFDTKKYPANQYSFDELNWFGLIYQDSYNRRGVMRSTVKFTAPVIKEDREVTTVVGGDDVNGKDIADIKVAVTQVVEDSEGILSLKSASQGRIAVNETPKSVPIRTNFNETAFFYPQLRTDEQGNVKFSFTAPESLTRWNVKMLAHTPDLYFGQAESQVVTQKELMVQMNLPRFVRRSDKLVLSANVINLTDKDLTANVQFELIDPATDKVICTKSVVPVLVGKNTGGQVVSCELSEFSAYELVVCKVVARSENFNDGEQKYLPVLPDKVLITESMPLTIRNNQTRSFNFESLLKNYSAVETKNLAVEFSSNPAWYAVQALPTIAEPENDDAIDIFTAYYANSLAGYIANSNPKLATMFDRWKKAGGSREALLSNLEKNAELKNMLLAETPWVTAAKDETEQKRQIALLFDLNQQKNKIAGYWNKLQELQLPSGAFPWFKGMSESRYTTQEILLNIGRLNRLTMRQSAVNSQQLTILAALKYLDNEIAKDFENLKKVNKNFEKEECINNMQLFYLHLRSEFPEIPVAPSAQPAVKFYTLQAEKYWTRFTLYGKAMMAVMAKRNGKTQLANEILQSLKENALKTDDLGMYWAKNTSGYFWNERPIAVQAALIEAFTEISKNTADIDEMKIWLLKQKQTQRWDSPMSTVEAIYALLNLGTDWLSNEGSVQITVGKTTLKPESIEAGTGYFKQTLPRESVSAASGKVTVSSQAQSTTAKSSIGWGAMYWQFYQDLDKVTGQSGALTVSKKLFVTQQTPNGKTLIPIEQTKLVKGDKVVTRLVVSTDRDLEFVALKDLRAACFEPVNQRSGCEWKENVCYYQTTKDASTQFFFSFLPKGTYVFEYELWVNNSGQFTSGIATIQCQYAPEFLSHSGGEKITIAK